MILTTITRTTRSVTPIIGHREQPTLGGPAGIVRVGNPGQPNGQPASPLVFQIVAALGGAGALRIPSLSTQLEPGFELLVLPPVDTTMPGVGVVVGSA